MEKTIRHIKKNEFVRKVRYVGQLTIYFKGKDEIVVSDGKITVLYERWYEGRGFYSRSWKPFMEALTRQNGLKDNNDVMRLARRYGVLMHATTKPEVPKDAVKLSAHFSARREHEEA